MNYTTIHYRPAFRITLTALLMVCALLAGGYVFNALSVSASSANLTRGQSAEAEQEPNDTPDQANEIGLPGRRTGSAKFGDAASFEVTAIGGQRDKIEDFFKFRITGTQRLRVDIKLTFDNGTADLDLFLFQKFGNNINLIAASTGNTTTEQLLPIPELEPGDYFIGVSAFDDPGNTASANYTLTTTLDTLNPPPTITRVIPGEGNIGTGPFSLTVRGTNFYDGQSVVRWNGQAKPTVFLSSTELVAFISPSDTATAGVVNISVANPAALGGASNAVSFAVSNSNIPPEIEPNETSATATLLLAPGKVRGSVAVGDASNLVIRTSGGISDPVEDLFAVNLQQSSRLELTLTGTEPNANLALYLLRETGNGNEVAMIENSRLGGPYQHLSTPVLLAPGRYLVGISALTGSSNYTLEASVPGNRLVQVTSSSAAPNSTVTVPITFYSEGNENTVNFSLLFNSALLSNPQVTVGADAAAATLNVNTTQQAQGRLGVQLALPAGQRFGTGAREIVTLKFDVAQNSGVGATVVQFGDVPVTRGMVDANGNAVIGTYQAGNVIITPGFESDVTPRPLGNGSVTIADWVQIGRFVTGLDTPQDGSEFQRADVAPRSTLGDGRLTIADWVMAGRYAAGVEAVVASGGPTTLLAGVASFEKVVDEQFAARSGLEQQQTRVIRVAPATFARGQENNVTIELDAQGNENALGLSVTFDPTQLTFVRAALGPDAAGALFNVNTAQTAQGRIGLGLALPSGQTFTPGTRRIITLTFLVPANSSVNSTTISFANEPIVREVADPNANSLPTTYQPGVVTIDPPISATPTLTIVNPNTVTAGGQGFTLSIVGNNFINGAVAKVALNGSTPVERVTEVVSPTQLRVTILPQDILEPGTLSVFVQNPPPNGGTSNTILINLINPVPTLTSLNPAAAAVGGPAFTLTVNGTNFVPGATVQWNGQNRLTTFVSSTQLTAQIPNTDLATAGTAQVRVLNPTPGGGTSNNLQFTISSPSPIPRLTSINPTLVDAGTAFTLTVTGQRFVPSSVVRLNGSPLPTTFISETELRAQVAATDIPTPGNASITVFNPAPGGGASNAIILNVNTPPNPVPTITGLSPNTVTSGGNQFVLTVSGTGFVQNSVIRINGEARPTTFVSATELRTLISAADILNGGTLNVTVFNPAPAGGASNTAPLTVNFAAPTITLLSPSSVVAGGAGFQLNVIGTNFAPGSVVRWNGQDRPTSFISVTELIAQISAADITNVGTAQVTVFSPPPGGGLSNSVTFAINQADRPVPRITSINPNEAQAGTQGLTLTVNGANFASDSVVRFNGQNRPTVFVNSTQLTAQLTAADLATPGAASITVFTPPAGGGVSNSAPFNINVPPNPVPRVTSISPPTIGAGTGAFTLTVNGENFVQGSTVQFNGANRPTTFVSATQLRAQIAAEDIPAAGTALIRVVSPAPGGGPSNDLTLTIINPVPTIIGTSPSAVVVGSPAFTLTVNGTGFVVGSQIVVNGTPRITSFVNSTQLTATVPETLLNNTGALNVQVINPAPGGGTSNSVTIPVRPRNPIPRITAINPNTVNAGGPGFTLVVTGGNFLPESVVRVNGEDRPTDFISDSALAAQILAADIADGGTLNITVFNPGPGGGTTGPMALQVINLVPRITSISPDSATAGSGPITLTVSGVNFVRSSVVRFGGTIVPTIFVTSSQLTATIPMGLLASGASAQVVVINPPPGGGTSNAVTFAISNPAPAITSLNPNLVVAGSGAFTLTVNGAGFTPVSVVRINGQERVATFVSPTQLNVAVPATDVLNGGQLSVMVTNPAPGGGTSPAASLTIGNPTPVLTSLNPASVAAGSSGFTLTITGAGFTPGSVVQFNGVARPTTFINSTQLRIDVTAADVANSGNATITVVNPAPGGGPSNALTLNITIQPNPAPTLTGLTPNSAPAGSGGFTLTVTGQNFVPGAEVRWNGQLRPTTFVNSTQLTAQIPASDLVNAGSALVTAVNPAPGGGSSNGLTFNIVAPNPVPTLTSVAPSTVLAGSSGFTLTVNGNGFTPSSVVYWNGSPRPTTFFSATQLFAQLTAADVAAAGTANVTVFNPAPGGGTSNGVTVDIVQQLNPVPVLQGMSPTSVSANDTDFTLTVFGSSFLPTSVVHFGGSSRPTTFISAGELRAQISAADITNPGFAKVTVFTPGPGGGGSNPLSFGINLAGSGCRTICFQSAQYYVLNPNRVPPQGEVLIGGVNNNLPVLIQDNQAAVQMALQAGGTPLSNITREYLAAQISILAADDQANVASILNSALRCYGLIFAEVNLTNRTKITPDTTVGTLLTQARLAILNSRTLDMIRIAPILLQLNGADPNSRCR